MQLSQKSPFITKRWISRRSLSHSHRGVKKNKKCVKTFDFLYGKQQEVGKFQSSGEDSGSGQRFVKRESRFHATNTFTGKRDRYLVAVPFGVSLRFFHLDVIKDSIYAFAVPCATPMIYGSLPVPSIFGLLRASSFTASHCASFPPLVNPWIHNNLKIVITFSRSSMEKLVEKSRGYMFCLFISGHERQGADTKVNTNGRKIITYTNKLGV